MRHFITSMCSTLKVLSEKRGDVPRERTNGSGRTGSLYILLPFDPFNGDQATCREDKVATIKKPASCNIGNLNRPEIASTYDKGPALTDYVLSEYGYCISASAPLSNFHVGWAIF